MKISELKALVQGVISGLPKPEPTPRNLIFALAGVFGFLTLLVFVRLFSSSSDESAIALAAGKRMVYDVATEEFIGGAKVEEKPAEEKPQQKLEKTPEEAAQIKPEEPQAEPESHAQPPVTTNGKKARIAIVVTGVGISKSSSEAAINLPSKISIAISPYSYLANEIIRAADNVKRNYLVEVPAEPRDYPVTDPGPHSLLCNNQLVENLSNLEWVLTRVKSPLGVVLPVGEKFSECSDNAKGVFDKLAEMNLVLVLLTPSASGNLPDSAQTSSAKSLQSNVIIDSVIDSPTIDANLTELEKIAASKGTAIGVARPYPISLKAISKWSETLEDRGFELVPISEMTNSE